MKRVLPAGCVSFWHPLLCTRIVCLRFERSRFFTFSGMPAKCQRWNAVTLNATCRCVFKELSFESTVRLVVGLGFSSSALREVRCFRIQTLTVSFTRNICCSVRETEIATSVPLATFSFGMQLLWKRPVEVPKSFLTWSSCAEIRKHSAPCFGLGF